MIKESLKDPIKEENNFFNTFLNYCNTTNYSDFSFDLKQRYGIKSINENKVYFNNKVVKIYDVTSLYNLELSDMSNSDEENVSKKINDFFFELLNELYFPLQIQVRTWNYFTNLISLNLSKQFKIKRWKKKYDDLVIQNKNYEKIGTDINNFLTEFQDFEMFLEDDIVVNSVKQKRLYFIVPFFYSSYENKNENDIKDYFSLFENNLKTKPFFKESIKFVELNNLQLQNYYFSYNEISFLINDNIKLMSELLIENNFITLYRFYSETLLDKDEKDNITIKKSEPIIKTRGFSNDYLFKNGYNYYKMFNVFSLPESLEEFHLYYALKSTVPFDINMFITPIDKKRIIEEVDNDLKKNEKVLENMSFSRMKIPENIKRERNINLAKRNQLDRDKEKGFLFSIYFSIIGLDEINFNELNNNIDSFIVSGTFLTKYIEPTLNNFKKYNMPFLNNDNINYKYTYTSSLTKLNPILFNYHNNDTIVVDEEYVKFIEKYKEELKINDL